MLNDIKPIEMRYTVCICYEKKEHNNKAPSTI